MGTSLRAGFACPRARGCWSFISELPIPNYSLQAGWRIHGVLHYMCEYQCKLNLKITQAPMRPSLDRTHPKGRDVRATHAERAVHRPRVVARR